MAWLAHKEKRFDYLWGLVNPGNALCASIHQTRREALEEKRKSGTAYTVIQVYVIPDYETDKGRKG